MRVATLMCGCGALLAAAAAGAAPGPQIITADVDRFFAVYDAAGGRPSADALQRDYLDPGTAGLHDFARLRGVTGESLAVAIAKNPASFTGARQCGAVLPAVRNRLMKALARLRTLYPAARFPPVTIVVGRGNSGGTTSASGVLIGLEALCSSSLFEADVEDRFVHLIAHEYAHVQQPAAEETDRPGVTVLFASLIEGGAEFVGELISGSVSYVHLHRWLKGRETEIERRLVADADKTDLQDWLYKGLGDAEHPGDIGYWAGYRVAQKYYRRSSDKERALRDILMVTPASAHKLLAASGISAR